MVVEKLVRTESTALVGLSQVNDIASCLHSPQVWWLWSSKTAVHIGMCELRFWRLRDLCIEPFDTWRQFGLPWSAEDQEWSEGSVGSWEAGHLCFSSRFERGYIGLNAFKSHFFRTNIQKPKDVRIIWIEWLEGIGCVCLEYDVESCISLAPWESLALQMSYLLPQGIQELKRCQLLLLFLW